MLHTFAWVMYLEGERLINHYREVKWFVVSDDCSYGNSEKYAKRLNA